MKTIQTLLLAAAAALLLPSCKQWFIGDHLRGASTSYTGVDIFHPVDGKIHFDTRQKNKILREAYVVAPEVTYCKQPPCWDASIHDIGDWSNVPAAKAENIRPTGRIVVAKIGYGGFREIVPALPKGLTAYDAPTHDIDAVAQMKMPHIVCYWTPEDIYPDSLGELGTAREEKPGFARRALIATCDYVVDPLLNILTIPVEAVGIIALSPIIAPVTMAIDSQEQQEPQPVGELVKGQNKASSIGVAPNL